MNTLAMIFSVLIFSVTAFSQMNETTDNTNNIRLDNIVVTSATLTETELASAPASMSVITQEDIEKQPVRDVADVLRYAEGVMITGANDKGISMRGFDSSYTLILVNGKRLSSRSLSVRHNADADLSWISPADIERIEIIRGPMATLYGAEAIGGVVNIITKKISNTWGGQIATTYTAPEEHAEGPQSQISTSVSGPIIKDKLGIRISGATTEKTRPDFPATESRASSGNKDKSYNTELSWKLNANNEVGFDFGQNFEEQTSLSRGQVATTKVDRTHAGLEHKGTWSKIRSEVRLFTDRYDYELSDQPAKLENNTAQAQLHFPLFEEKHFFVTGIDVEQNKLKNEDQLDSGETSADQTSVFIEDSIAMTDRNTLTVGARQIEHQKFGGHTSPRAYWVYNATSDMTIKGGVGTGFKTPTLLQMDEGFHLPSCQGNCTMLGNPDLKPESSVNYEIGTTWTKERWTFNATIFQSELKDMITTYFTTIGGTRYRLLHNVDEARTRGIELGGKVELSRFVTLGSNLTMTEARNLSLDTSLSTIPDYVANLKIDWSATEKLSTYAVASLTGNRTIEGTSGSIHTDPYTIINLGAAYKLPTWLLERSTISGGIENIANTLLSDEYGYGEPGRRYFVKLNIL
ncbi:TonB-dependent receptor domain-containing protein [Bdellovibrio sp. HCB209]|uniref:TonB-dependent receptor domain-containing protein n=1 Tax=Bdellovibrio sp. HCB209 TaxID=3394354 RepID=UPI0039B5B7DC